MEEVNTEGREDQVLVDPWRKSEDIVKEIKEKQQVVDYSQIVGDNRIVFFAEDHSNNPIRKHIIEHARDLKDAGITHYAIEANEAGNEIFEKLNKGEQVDLSKTDVGPALSIAGHEGYEGAIRAIAAQGIKVVAIDIDRSTKPSGEEREARLFENTNRLIQEDPNAKVAVLIGAYHTFKNHAVDGVPSIGKRFMDAHVPSVNVRFAGGQVKGPTILTDAVSKAGLANQEFMLDLRPYAGSINAPYKGEVDWAMHLPQDFSSEHSSNSRAVLESFRSRI